MSKIGILILFLIIALNCYSQQWSATTFGFMKGNLLKGKWQYSHLQKLKSEIDFSGEKIIIKDSSGTVNYRLLKDIVTKRVEEDSCIASIQTGYDKNNIRCMVNLLEFNNGVNILNILYGNLSYSYYFRRSKN